MVGDSSWGPHDTGNRLSWWGHHQKRSKLLPLQEGAHQLMTYGGWTIQEWVDGSWECLRGVVACYTGIHTPLHTLHKWWYIKPCWMWHWEMTWMLPCDLLWPAQAGVEAGHGGIPLGMTGSVVHMSMGVGWRLQAQWLCWLTGFHLLHWVGASLAKGQDRVHKILRSRRWFLDWGTVLQAPSDLYTL